MAERKIGRVLTAIGADKGRHGPPWSSFEGSLVIKIGKIQFYPELNILSSSVTSLVPEHVASTSGSVASETTCTLQVELSLSASRVGLSTLVPVYS